MWRYATAVLIAFSQLPSTARAEQTVNEFLKVYDSAKPEAKVIFHLAIRQTFNGIEWVNSYLQQNDQRLYCPPSQIVLVDTQLIDMLRREAKISPAIGNAPYGFALLVTSIKLFPCKISN